MGWGWQRQARAERGRRACQGPGREWVSRAVCSWQAIRHARSMGGSSSMAGEEWKEGGGSCPPHRRTKYKLS